MAIVLWTLAGSAPENGSKGDTLREGGTSEEEPGEKKNEQESSEERKSPAGKETADLEDKVCCIFLSYYTFIINFLLTERNGHTGDYYSTNSRDAHIWSESHCYPSSVHNRYQLHVAMVYYSS